MSYKHYYKKKKLLATDQPGCTSNNNHNNNNKNHHYNNRNNQTEFLNLTETILEGQFISCYLINSEPRLCLSQILSKVLIHFPIEQIRDKFCELGIYCRPCTPTQLQLFKSHCILPNWVNLCGLITKSDAERLCLDLFNTIIPKKRLDYESIMQPGNSFRNYNSNKNYYFSGERNHDAFIGMLLSQKPMGQSSFQANPIESILEQIDQDRPINYTSKRKSIDNDSKVIIKSTDCTYQSCLSNKAFTPNKTDYFIGPSLLQTDNGNVKKFLIEIDKHRELACLASNASALMFSIRVYHRCIGKCTGLYYPAFYHNPNSQCVECVNCHCLFSPRRFIGHTHGSKESRICHWGLDSYKWRHYIRLSKTQQTNNLEELELLKIFHDMQNRFEYIEFYNKPQKSTDKYSQMDSRNAGHSTGLCEYDQIRKCKQTTTCSSSTESAENFCGNKRVKLLDQTKSTNRSSKLEYNNLVSSHIPLSHNVINFDTCQDISMLSGLEKILTRNGAKFDLKHEILEEALLIMSKVRATTLLNNLTPNCGSLNHPNYRA